MPKLENRRGVTLVLMAFMLTVLIGSAAFAVDFGRMYLFRAQLHAAADAAALAGVFEIAEKIPDKATDTAIAYAARHTVGTTTIILAAADVIPGEWTPGGGFVPSTWTDPNLDAVQVTTRYPATYGFGKILGLGSRNVTATSQAVLGYVGATTCVRPVAIPYQSLLNQLYDTNATGGTTAPGGIDHVLTDADIAALRAAREDKAVSLKLGSDATQGNFYIVDLGPYSHVDRVPLIPGPTFGGNNIFSDRFGGDCANSPWSIGPGDWLQGKSGNAAGPTESGFEELCNISMSGTGTFGCTGASIDKRSIKVAMWSTENDAVCTPKCFQVKLVGVFVVTGFTKSPGGDDGIIGYFTSIPSNGTMTMTPSPIQKIGLVK